MSHYPENTYHGARHSTLLIITVIKYHPETTTGTMRDKGSQTHKISCSMTPLTRNPRADRFPLVMESDEGRPAREEAPLREGPCRVVITATGSVTHPELKTCALCTNPQPVIFKMSPASEAARDHSVQGYPSPLSALSHPPPLAPS